MPGSLFLISLVAGVVLALPWPAAAQSPDELRLNYSVLYSSNLEGPFALAPSSRAFRSGEWVKLQVSSNSEGYLYILIKESDGKSQVLFPDAAGKINRNMNRVRPGMRTTVPVNGAFRIAGSAGSDELTIVVSRIPLVEPERLLGAGGEAAAELLRSRLPSNTRAFVFEPLPPQPSASAREREGESVTNPRAGPEGLVYVKFSIRH